MLRHEPVEALYLTPQLTEVAMRAGIIAFGGSKQHMEGIYNLVASEVPECMPPHSSINNLVFVARWAGRFGVGKDVDPLHAGGDQPYLAANDYAHSVPARGFTEANGWTTHSNLITPEKTIIDITLGSWNRPEFGYKVAVGLTPQLAHINEGEWIANAVGVGHVDRRRMSRTQASLQYEHPFSILRAPGRPYKKAPPGASPYS